MTGDLEAKIRLLEDIQAIKNLKTKYWHSVDLRLWDDFGSCFADDAANRFRYEPRAEKSIGESKDVRSECHG